MNTLDLAPSQAERDRHKPAPENKARTSSRVIQLDFVRGIAILLVMEYHFLTVPVQNPLARAFEFFAKRIGWMGVDLFFVLSGFLVGGLLIQELIKSDHIRVGRFLIRRMFKIWPAYYLYILVQAVFRKHPLNSFLWQNAFHIQNYAGTSLPHTWSLAVEEHFYLILPPVLLLLYRNQKLRKYMVPLLGLCCLLVLGGRIVSIYLLHSGDLQTKTHARVDSLLFGVILSYLFYLHRRVFNWILKRRLALLLASIAGILIALHEGRRTDFMESLGFTLNYVALGALLLLVYGYHGKFTQSFLYRAIAYIGLYSYGIYLWHLAVREPLLALSTHLPLGVRWGSLVLAQYSAAIILGIAVTKAVEFPMLRVRDRLFPRGPATTTPSVA